MSRFKSNEVGNDERRLPHDGLANPIEHWPREKSRQLLARFAWRLSRVLLATRVRVVVLVLAEGVPKTGLAATDAGADLHGLANAGRESTRENRMTTSNAVNTAQ